MAPVPDLFRRERLAVRMGAVISLTLSGRLPGKIFPGQPHDDRAATAPVEAGDRGCLAKCKEISALLQIGKLDDREIVYIQFIVLVDPHNE